MYFHIYTCSSTSEAMLLMWNRKVATVLPLTLLLALILLIYYTNGQIPLLPQGSGMLHDALRHSPDNSRLEAEQGEIPLSTSLGENSIAETHNQVFSASTNDKKYF